MSKSAGNVVIVTGGASGIGAASVEVLLEKGWRVAVLDLEGKGLATVRASYGAREDVRITAVDVTDEAAVDAEITAIEKDFGPIHGVLNSAGIAADKHVFDTPAALFRKILDINVVGSFIVGRAAARFMAKRKAGSIVNMASVSGLRGNKGRSAYGASKGAIITMTQVMANDLAPHGIRVNALAPGPTETPMVQAFYTDADRALWTGYVPMGRFGTPREMGNVIAFLLDPEASSFVNGAVIPVDGGFNGAGIIVRDKQK